MHISSILFRSSFHWLSLSLCLLSQLQTGTSYALKTLLKDKLKKPELQKLREEVRIMAALDHPNILRINECFEDETSIKLVLDLCQGGKLLIIIHEIRTTS